MSAHFIIKRCVIKEGKLLQKSRLRNFLKVIFIIALFVCISYTNGTNRKVTLIEELLSDLIMAPQKIFVYFKNFPIVINNVRP